MAKLGADVIKVKGNYENSLVECIKQSIKNNWKIVQDVAWNNYMTIPKYTMAGYSVMMKEIVSQISENKISHIILQAGVGGMAAGMIAGIARYLETIPIIIVVEPDSASCVLESIRIGEIKKIDIMTKLRYERPVIKTLNKGVSNKFGAQQGFIPHTHIGGIDSD